MRHSCRHCQRLVLTGHREGMTPAAVPGFSEHSMFFDMNLNDLRQAALDGCVLIQKMTAFWTATEFLHYIVPSENLRLFAKYYFTSGEQCQLEFGLWDRSKDEEYPQQIRYVFHLFTAEDNLRWISTRPIERWPSTARTDSLVKSWLEECLCSHHHSRIWDAQRVRSPSRLLKIHYVGLDYSLSLIDGTSGEDYVALSYCWGGNQRHKTTKENVKYSTSIGYHALPKTIQDAVVVTTRLGYRHLWVDSMCIIQDDDDDIAQEIAKMPMIYSNAVFTLVIACASSVDEGFLEERPDANADISELHYCESSGEKSILCVIADEGLSSKFAEEPLDSRGWALQERLLSARIVEYSSRQMRWSCPEHEGRDGWTKDAEAYYPNTDFIDLNATQEELPTTWLHAVEVYTARKLTNAYDRMLAISGIAHRFGTRNYDEYIAGHWLSMLPLDLLWTVQHDKVRWEEGGYRRRFDVLQGPSWAWISVHAPIYFLRYPDSGYKESVNMLSYDLRLKDEFAPYGDVTMAVLTVKGRLTRAVYKRTPEWNATANPFVNQLLLHESTGELVARPEIDDPENGNAGMYMYLLEIATKVSRKHSYTKSWGLVLASAGSRQGKRCFTRMGVFRSPVRNKISYETGTIYDEGALPQRDPQEYLFASAPEVVIQLV